MSTARVRWVGCLLCLAWVGHGAAADVESGEGWRSTTLTVEESAQPGFELMAEVATGVNFTNLLSEARAVTNQVLFNGSGVAAGDYDGDGRCDLYFCSLDGPNRLYRNLGSWRFELVTNQVVLECVGQASTGAVFADVDGDGDLDLLVTSFGRGVRLFENAGQGRFRETTEMAGLAGQAGSTTLALADIDGDGDLDLYQANYRTETLQDHPNTVFRLATQSGPPRIVSVDGRPASEPDLRDRYYVEPRTLRVMENGEADVLYLNQGGGRFQRASADQFRDERGQPVPTPMDWGLTAMFRDFNQDGAPDLYVCNDSDSPDRIWLNDGRGGFRALSNEALRKSSFSSMGVDVADLDRDGWDEIMVTDMLSYERALRHTQMVDRRPPGPPGQWQDRPAYMQNTLFWNRGDGTYAELAYFAGLEASDWSWAPVFLDVDLDGYEDLLVTTGLSRAFRDADARRLQERKRTGMSAEELGALRLALPPLDTPHRAFRNRGDLTFEEVGTRWGFDSRRVGQGMALADLDNDGDLDVVVNALNAPAFLYRNLAGAPRLAVRLKGRAPNTRGIGARIVVRGLGLSQSQEMICGGRYLSGDEAMRVFALPRAEQAREIGNRQSAIDNRVEVVWRSGARSVIAGVMPNRLYEIEEPNEKGTPETLAAPPAWFEDRSGVLGHFHHEAPFDDFALQPLLSRQLSRLGPGLAWFDLDGNGWEDLMVPSGRGGQMTFFLNDGKGAFQRLDTAELTGDNDVDQGMVLGWARAGNQAGFLVSRLNYEGGGTNVEPLRCFQIGAEGARATQTFPGQSATAGPVALADVDADGDLDLFVGGRVSPGRYPEAVSSRLYRFEEGSWLADTNSDLLWREVGLVSGAVFTDLDGDGWPELALACEWGPVRIYHNRAGTFERADWGINTLTGWWNSVAAGDFDGDGKMDLVAGNWGENSKYRRYSSQPLAVYFGEATGDQRLEVVEAHRDPVLAEMVPWRFWDTMSAVIPDVMERCSSFAAYSTSSVQRVLGEHWQDMQKLEASTLQSVVFLNRGDSFLARPLPWLAQISPAFGLAVADFDGDGREDLFMAQNFFGVDAETGRYDAGRGLVLRGQGDGQFIPVVQSGVRIYGEQRGAAVCDFDGDGRVDLAVAQNGAATRLYRNVVGKPGLRVRLIGSPNNPTGVGAVLRLRFGERWGPAREVHAGAGYWSQDSPVSVLTGAAGATALWVRWPGGQEATATLPEGAREVVVDVLGRFGVIR